MYSLIRPFLFSLETERAHRLSLSALHYLPKCCFKMPNINEVEALGLRFSHPVGLAAGLDKNAEHVDALSKLGFSFIEVGTVTPRPQAGNSKPRLFRLPEAKALINRMGFNNLGVDNLVANLARVHYRGIIGINIGKNKDTPLNRAIEDYRYCLKKAYQQADYITINLSSPNTPGLRKLQQEAFLPTLLGQLCEEQKRLAEKTQRWVPLAVKLSPDESDETLKRMAQCIVEQGIAGIIATNTTCSREGVTDLAFWQEEGGLSGKPLRARSTRCLQIIKTIVGEEVSLIGVGGIDSPQSAQEKIAAGASLLQIYSGLIYQGPGLVTRLANNL